MKLTNAQQRALGRLAAGQKVFWVTRDGDTYYTDSVVIMEDDAPRRCSVHLWRSLERKGLVVMQEALENLKRIRLTQAGRDLIERLDS